MNVVGEQSAFIIGSGINLRPLTAADAPDMYEAIQESNDALSTTMSWWHEEMSMEEIVEWTQIAEGLWARAEHYEFCIEDQETGHYLGSLAIGPVNRGLLSANLSYWVRTSQTGRGIASQATRLGARWACSTLGLQRVEILIATGNTPSIRVARKAGAHEEGVLRNRLHWFDTLCDAMVFSYVPADFGRLGKHGSMERW